MMLGFLVAACSFEPSGQSPVDDPDASVPGADGRVPDDGPPPPPTDGNFDPPWWNRDFEVRVPITIAEPPTTETLADVPVLVVLDAERVDYDRAADDGRDLRVVDAAGTELVYEIEQWDPAGRSFLWVRVPELAPGASTPLWLYYGNPEADAPGGSVWSDDYLAVWHLAEDTTAGQSGVTHRDATGRGNDGTQDGNSRTEASDTAIGGAQAFDGDDDFIRIPQGNLQETGTALTLLARVYVDEEPNDFSIAVGSGSDSDLQWLIAWSRPANAWTGRIGTEEAYVNSVSSESAALQTWYLLAMVYDGAEARLYVDGEPLGNAVTIAGDLKPLPGPLYIGNNPDEGSSELDGIVDEVRVAKVAHSQSWLRVQHASMNDDLVDFGTTECLSGC